MDVAPEAEAVTTDMPTVSILLDESADGGGAIDTRYTMVGATAFESSLTSTEARLQALHSEILGLEYLDGLPSILDFKSYGFHASTDPIDASVRFIQEISKRSGFKSYVLFSDGTRRPDLDRTATYVVLYHELLVTLLREYRSFAKIELVFEQNDALDPHLRRIVDAAASVAGVRGEISVTRGVKMAPLALAVTDYTMAVFARWRQKGFATDRALVEYRDWCAIRGGVSLVRSLELGTLIRRGQPAAGWDGGRRSTRATLNARDTRTQDGSPGPTAMLPDDTATQVSIHDLLRSTHLELRQLEGMATELAADHGYRNVRLKKRRGGHRNIYMPELEYKSILKTIRDYLEPRLVYTAHPRVFGYIPGRSTLDNARGHLQKDAVLSVDLLDFFQSITAEDLEVALTRNGCQPDLSALLTRLFTIRGRLPAGFPGSPYLSNLVFEDTDNALQTYCDSNSLVYSRYADDIAISGEVDDSTLARVESLLMEHGWALNHSKSHFMRKGGSQYVTGLYVGEVAPRAPRRIKRAIRATVHSVTLRGFHPSSDSRIRTRRQLVGWLNYLRNAEPALVTWAWAQLEKDPTRYPWRRRRAYEPTDDNWNRLLRRLGLREAG